jgi:hypothetical protein
LLLRSAEYKVSFQFPDGKVVPAFEADIGDIGRPGTRTATDPPFSITPRQLANEHPELADLLTAD